MAFLFKSKKNQDRALASRDGNAGSQGSAGSGRNTSQEKNGQRSTPTGSLNSIDNDAVAGSPERGPGRRNGSIDQNQPQAQAQQQPQSQQLQPQQSDLPVSRNFKFIYLCDMRPLLIVFPACRISAANVPFPSFAMAPRRHQIVTAIIMLRYIPGLNGGLHTPRRTRVRSLVMAPLSILYRPKRATST